MADKFPEIDNTAGINEDPASNSDFLSREKEVLGDEFKSENDDEIMKQVKGEDDDDEFDDFKSQFPEVSTNAAVTESEDLKESEVNDEDNNNNNNNKQEDNETTDNNNNNNNAIINKFNNLDLNDSEHVQEWKKTRDLEIAKRDEIAQRKLEDIKKEAEKAIDDFYENYNNKKDDAIAETKKVEKEFIEKRDHFLENGTVWDRVVELLKLDKNSDTIDSDNLRDKTKFRDLLLALKGKEGVPGASGI